MWQLNISVVTVRLILWVVCLSECIESIWFLLCGLPITDSSYFVNRTGVRIRPRKLRSAGRWNVRQKMFSRLAPILVLNICCLATVGHPSSCFCFWFLAAKSQRFVYPRFAMYAILHSSLITALVWVIYPDNPLEW